MLHTFQSLAAEIQDRIHGRVFFDQETRLRFSTAACWYRIIPIGVVAPADVEDVQNVVRFCYDEGIAVIPRGGGTGLAGQAVGLGIILDFTQIMNRIVAVEDDTVRVQPGVVLRMLNETLAQSGRFFPVDPASERHCTIGGMIGTNAAGAHGIKYGAMKDHVKSLTVVLSNGECAIIAERLDSPTGFMAEIVERITVPLHQHRELILNRFPKVQKNSSGYNLKDAVQPNHIDLRKLIVGSEGTLAIVVEAELPTSRIPQQRAGLLAYFADYESSVEATLKGLEYQPGAIEILDRTYFMLGRDRSLVREEAQTMLYFEWEGNCAEEVYEPRDAFEAALPSLHALHSVRLDTEGDRQALWRLREEVSETINLSKSNGKTSFIEDVAVPLPNLPAYMRGLQEILNRYNIDFSLYGHAGTGNIHCATFADPRKPEHYRVIDNVASEVYDLAIQLGGTLSGEHGDGFVRTPFLERLYGRELYDLFTLVKDAFDPRNILNPGKIVGKQNVSILHDLALA